MNFKINKVRKNLRSTTALFFFVSGIITGTWTSRIPEIQHKFELNDATWGAVLFSLPVGLVLGMPLSGWLVAKFTSYRMIAISGLIYILFLCLIPLASGIVLLVLSLFFFGLSRSLFNIALNTNAIEVQKFFPRSIVATFHGIWSLACLVAAGIGTAVIGYKLLPKYHFMVIAGLAIVLVLFFRIKRNNKASLTAIKRPFFVKPDKFLLLLGMMGFCTMMCEGTMFDWGINYFHRVIKAEGRSVTLGYTCFISAMTIGRFVGDKLIHYFGKTTLLIIDGAFIVAGFAIAVIFPYWWSAAAGFLLIGFGDATIVPIIYMLAGQSKMLPGYAIAAVTIIAYSGFLLAPLLVGSVSQAFGMQTSFALMIFFSSSISLIAYYIHKNQTTLVTA